MDFVQERYNPVVVAANSSVTVTGGSLGGFLAQTSGTISFVKQNAAQTVLLNAFPVTAGVYLPLPFFVGINGGTFTTAGGASGLLCVG